MWGKTTCRHQTVEPKVPQLWGSPAPSSLETHSDSDSRENMKPGSSRTTFHVYLHTSDPFLLLIQSHCHLRLCQMKWPFDDSHSVCHRQLLLLAPACFRLTLPPAFVICSIGREPPTPHTCHTAEEMKTQWLMLHADLWPQTLSPSDSEAEDWAVIKGTVRVSVLD